MSKSTNHRVPNKFTGLRIGSPKKKAAGMKALQKSLAQLRMYMKTSDAVKASLRMNQKGGFDCPGCAWPDPDDDRSALGEYCENGVKALAEEAMSKTIDAKFFKDFSVETLSQLSDFELGKLGRLAEPMYLAKGGTNYEAISWEEAFQKIGDELNALDSPDEAIFYTSGRTSNEAAFLYQLFVRAYGTNNLPDCSNMCHESSGVGLSNTVGIGKGSVTLKDIYEAEVVIVMGQNPGTNHPRMLSALERNKENGGKIITVNPLPEAGLINFVNPQRPLKMISGGTALTDLFLPVRVNGDVAFLKALMKILLEKDKANPGIVDHDFIKNQTAGYDKFISHINSVNLDTCILESGLSKSQIEEAADLIANKSKIIICWAMGLTQHENGVDNIQEVVNLLLLKGAIGKPGAGTCPVRGHSNVQGDRTMGIWEAPKEGFLKNLDKVFQIKSPRKHGHSTVDAIVAMHEGKGKVFFAMGGNFLSATPDTDYTAEALRRCDLTVQVSTKLNRSHLVHGKEAIILPCLGRSEVDVQNNEEQFVSVENSMGVVHSSKGVLKPCSKKLKSEPEIVSLLGLATLKGSSIPWKAMSENYDLIRAKIEAVIPGFENYNQRVLEPGGFYLPNGARTQEFNTPDGKAHFTTNPLPNNELEVGEFIMMTIRSHDQFNTTIYGLDDRYRGIYNERRVILMNQEDMNNSNLSAKQRVDIHNVHNGKKRSVYNFLVVPYPIPKGCTATYFPEANPLIPIDSFARKSKTPTSKKVYITIEPSNEPA